MVEDIGYLITPRISSLTLETFAKKPVGGCRILTIFLMDASKIQTRRKETPKPETSVTHRNRKRNVEEGNEPHRSKKSKISGNEQASTYTLRSRVRKYCSPVDTLETDLNFENLQNSDDEVGNSDRKHDKHTKKSNKKPNRENLPSQQEEIVSEEFTCQGSKKFRKKNSDKILVEQLDPDSSFIVDLSSPVKRTRKIMQPIKGLKRVDHGKKCSESNDTEKQNSRHSGHSGNMLHQLPSKFDMFTEFPKSLVENKFGFASGQPASKPSSRSDNLLHLLMDNCFGMRGGVRGKKIILKTMADGISDFHLVRTGSPFDRRCTAMAWHPFNPNLLVIGSKGGDICLMDLENSSQDVFMPGCGLGGVIQAMKFIPQNTTSLHLLTASMDGTVILRDLAVQSTLTTFVDTSHLIHQFWYCSCDVSPSCDMFVHGDSLGNATLQTMDGEKIWSHKLHKNKINSTEFHRNQEWLLCTASTDQYVRLWDIRMLKNQDSYLTQLKHEKGVNAAYFSNTDGTRLLTTDQHHELRVYECGSWNLEQTIEHPHRFYQHLTPMKAAWHPLEDMIVCGRYPDKSLHSFASDNERGIDFIDPFTAKNICRLYDPVANGIVTLAQFNNIGSTLAATMGYTILIWQKDNSLEEENKLKAVDRPYGFKQPDDSTSSGPSLPPKSRAKTKLQKSTKTKQSDS